MLRHGLYRHHAGNNGGMALARNLGQGRQRLIAPGGIDGQGRFRDDDEPGALLRLARRRGGILRGHGVRDGEIQFPDRLLTALPVRKHGGMYGFASRLVEMDPAVHQYQRDCRQARQRGPPHPPRTQRQRIGEQAEGEGDRIDAEQRCDLDGGRKGDLRIAQRAPAAVRRYQADAIFDRGPCRWKSQQGRQRWKLCQTVRANKMATAKSAPQPNIITAIAAMGMALP